MKEELFYRKLIVYQKAMDFVTEIYRLLKTFPSEEKYALCDQIRRAAVSIGSNVAEGFDRGNNKEFLTFLGVAKGSAAEVRSQLYTAYDVGYLQEEKFKELISQAEEVSMLINGLSSSLRKSNIQGRRYHKL